MSGVSPRGLTNRIKPECGRLTVRETAKDFAVFDPDGVRISDPVAAREKAIALLKTKQAAADRAARRTIRPCLCCGSSFASQGIHNRMCDRCRHQTNSDMAPASVGSLSGLKRRA